MLDLKQIETFYPEPLRGFKRNLLREYLQYKILEIIYDADYGRKLVFMGGTAIHIIHDSSRFSEDLDFDNLGLRAVEFGELAQLIKKKLALQGYPLETKVVTQKAFRIYLNIPEVFFRENLSTNPKERVRIYIDAEPQGFTYKPDQVLINKFDVFGRMSVVPADVLLAQKISCIFNRKRPLGRDFYDAVYLMGKTKTNMKYVKQKLHITGLPDLRARLIKRCQSLDFKQLAKDVEPFLFRPEDSKRVLHFIEYIEQKDF